MDDNLFYEKISCGETGSEGTCTFDPTFIAIRETISFYAKTIAFYLTSFRDTEYYETEMAEKIIKILSTVIVNADFNSKEFENIIIEMYNTAQKYNSIYTKHFNREAGIVLPDAEPIIIDIIKYGEKNIVKNNLNFSKQIRDMYSVVIYGLRSAAVYINELKYYNKDISGYTNFVLDTLNKLNDTENTFDDLFQIIKDFSKIHLELVNELETALIENFGPFVHTEVNKTLKQGASILVSGHNFYELKRLLDATKDENINIYTHDGLINAHSYLKFREYPNLVGHFQRFQHSTPSDFTAFKGAILITSTPMDEFDSFVRGKIFTTSLLSGLGITKVDVNDFSKLIQTSKDNINTIVANEQLTVSVGNISENIDDIISLIIEKFEKKEIERIFILKIDKHTVKKQEQIEKLLDSLPDNVFIFSTFEIKRQNFLKIDAFYDYGILYFFINKLKTGLKMDELPITLFVSHCNLHTLAHLITLYFTGIKNIYLANCSYFMINPTVFESVKEIFGIKSFNKLLDLSDEEINKELYG